MVEVVAARMILLWGEVYSGEVVSRTEGGCSGREMRTIGETGRAGWGRGNRTRK